MQEYVKSNQSAIVRTRKLKAGVEPRRGLSPPPLPLSLVGGHPRAARLWEIADNETEREVTQMQPLTRLPIELRSLHTCGM